MLRDGLTDEMADELPGEDVWWGRADKGIIHDENFQKEFMEMVDDLNDLYRVLGYPMRFTATGKINHNW